MVWLKQWTVAKIMYIAIFVRWEQKKQAQYANTPFYRFLLYVHAFIKCKKTQKFKFMISLFAVKSRCSYILKIHNV